MKNIIITSLLFSFSRILLADTNCQDLSIYPSMFVKGTGDVNCDYFLNHVKNYILIQASSYEHPDDFNALKSNDIIPLEEQETSCGVASHYYIEENGRIVQARDDYQLGPAASDQLVIQVLLPKADKELSPRFVENFSQLLSCKIKEHHIVHPKDVIVSEDRLLNPGQRIRDLAAQILKHPDNF